tara:strand:+ start:473 stop:844 length:372 start_codon:yes stop_codon:yes gene_type:complete
VALIIERIDLGCANNLVIIFISLTAPMSQFGGMIAFKLTGGKQAGIDMMNSLELISHAVSLGDAETLVQHPASMTHSTYSTEELAEHGISEGLVRLSIGLEGVDDILADLAQALPQMPIRTAA